MDEHLESLVMSYPAWCPSLQSNRHQDAGAKAHNEGSNIHVPTMRAALSTCLSSPLKSPLRTPGRNEAPVQFIESIGALPTFNAKVIKDQKAVKETYDEGDLLGPHTYA